MINREKLRELCFKKMEKPDSYCDDIVDMSQQLAEDMNILEIETLFDIMAMSYFKYVLTRSDNEEQYDFEFASEMMSRIINETRSQGLSDANALYFLFLGYMEYMKALGQEAHPDTVL